MYLTGIW